MSDRAHGSSICKEISARWCVVAPAGVVWPSRCTTPLPGGKDVRPWGGLFWRLYQDQTASELKVSFERTNDRHAKQRRVAYFFPSKMVCLFFAHTLLQAQRRCSAKIWK